MGTSRDDAEAEGRDFSSSFRPRRELANPLGERTDTVMPGQPLTFGVPLDNAEPGQFSQSRQVEQQSGEVGSAARIRVGCADGGSAPIV